MTASQLQRSQEQHTRVAGASSKSMAWLSCPSWFVLARYGGLMKGFFFPEKGLPQQRGAVLEPCYLGAMHTIIEQVLRPETVGVVKSLPEVLARHRVRSQQ